MVDPGYRPRGRRTRGGPTVASWLLLCCAAAAQNARTGSLTVRLTDLESVEVPGASVILRNQETGREARSNASNKGLYRFTGLEPGIYQLEADSPRLGSGHVEDIPVSAGDETRLTAALSFEASSADALRQPPAPVQPPTWPERSPAVARHSADGAPDVRITAAESPEVAVSLATIPVNGMTLGPGVAITREPPAAANASFAALAGLNMLGLAPGELLGATAAKLLDSAPQILPALKTSLDATAVFLTGEEIQALPLTPRAWETLTSSIAGRAIEVAPVDEQEETAIRASSEFREDGLSGGSAYARGRQLSGLAQSNATAIEEVRVADRLDADGSRAGPAVDVETRSGIAGLRGQAFFFDRQNTWGARNPFAEWIRESAPATSMGVPTFAGTPYSPSDRRFTLGMGMGGSLRRERVFWFAAVDAEQRTSDAVSTVKHPEGFFAQPSNDEMQALSARLGLSNADPVGGGLKEYSSMLEKLAGLLGPADRSATLWTGFGRADIRAGERHRFSIEGSETDWDSPGGGMARTTLAFGSHTLGSPHATNERIASRWEAFLTEDLLATTAVSYSSSAYQPKPERPSAYEKTLLANLWGELPQIVVDNRYGFTIGKLARFGTGTDPQAHSTDLQEHLDWVHGGVLLKSGFEWRHDHDAVSLLRNHSGTYVYSRVENFVSDALAFVKYGMADALDPLQQHNCDQRGRAWRDSVGQLHGLGYLPCYSHYTQTLGPTAWQLSTNGFAAWTTAQWQPVKSLVLSTALRWDRQQLPPPAALVNNPVLPLTEKTPALGNEWGARASLAWGMREGHWPTVRLGYGGYFGRTDNAVLMTALTQTGSLKGDLRYFFRPTDNLAGGGAPPFPYVYADQPANAIKPGAVEFGSAYRNAEIHQGELSLDETLPGRVLVSIAAQLSLARRLPVTADTNIDSATNPGTITYAVADPLQKGPIRKPQITVPFFASWPVSGDGGRQFAQYQQIAQLTSRANSTYEAVQVRLARSAGKRFVFNARYAYGHAWDWNPNETSAIGGSSIFDPTNLRLDYGGSDLDVRHSVSGWLIWESPLRRRNAESWWSNGWRVSAVGQYHSGLPYTMRTAGAIPEIFTTTGAVIAGLGPGMNGYGGDNRVYGVGRNTFRYPGAWKVDLRAGRRFALGRARELEFLAQTFNLFNHQNVTQLETVGYVIGNGNVSGALPTLTFMSGHKTGQTEFGKPLDINGTDSYRQREIEFGLRLRFRVEPFPADE